MSYKYPEHIINMVVDECKRLSLLNTTPRKYSVNMFQAAEIIRQLQNKIKNLESRISEIENITSDEWDLLK